MAWSDSEQKFEKTEELDEEHDNFLTKHVGQAKGIRPRFRMAQEVVPVYVGLGDRFQPGRLDRVANLWSQTKSPDPYSSTTSNPV